MSQAPNPPDPARPNSVPPRQGKTPPQQKPVSAQRPLPQAKPAASLPRATAVPPQQAAIPPRRTAVPAQAVPAQAVPAQAVPAQAVPAQAVPAQAVSAKAVPAQAVSGQGVAVHAIPVQASLPGANAVEATPALAFPVTTEPRGSAPKSLLDRKRRKSSWKGPAALGVFALLAVAGGFAVWKFVLHAPALAIAAIPIKSVNELAELKFTVPFNVSDMSPDLLEFALEDAPPGAELNAKTGEFIWTPTEEQGPGEYKIGVRVAAQGHADLHDKKSFIVAVKEVDQKPVMSPIENKTVKIVDGEVQLAFTLEAKDPDLPAQSLRFIALQGCPAGTKVNPQTGEFEWRSKSTPGNKDLEFTVAVSKGNNKSVNSKQTFTVHVEPEDRPIDLLAALFRKEGAMVEFVEKGTDPNLDGKGESLKIGSDEVLVFEYPSPAAMNANVAKIGPDATMDLGRLKPWPVPAKLFRKGRMIVVYVGDNAQIVEPLKAYLGEPFAVAKVELASKPTFMPPLVPNDVDAAILGDEEILESFRDKNLFVAKEYATLRRIYANRFEKQFEAEIKQAFGNDHAEMTAFFNLHKDIKEEFYTAINPQHDKLVPALTLFKDLYKQFPKQFVAYANLAIATAVTWDDPRGIYKFQDHQIRTKSIMPSDQIEAIENFKYFLDAEEVMQGRAQFVPWEFLTHMVNHTTPIVERQWALQNYLPYRLGFGKCYSDVPYDTEMYKSGSMVCKLAGKPYSLPSIREIGGVCAMQADFAARVGKSLGVPAAYVGDESAPGDLHAWVMWVELKQVTQSSLSFSLESHGRYNYDKYYVGTSLDPQTGKMITDRELELRLQTVGINPMAKRHADLIMRAYPMLREKDGMDIARQLFFLADVMTMSPGNEACWYALAKISKDGEVKKAQQKQIVAALDVLFRTFANFPDFTWKVFDDLISFQDDAKQRIKLYEQLVVLYESADRPDLACEARLKLSDYLVAEKKNAAAVEGLAFTVKKFPKEGRYVPKLVDKIEEICKAAGGADAQLVQFYQEFLPMIPQTRGSDPSKYCMTMYERAVKRFTELKQDDLAQLYSAQLAQLKAKAIP
jgi:hypothetical protein